MAERVKGGSDAASARGDARVRARLEELARQYGLAARPVKQLEELLHLLDTDPHAPTTVRDPVRAVDVHVADSLTALDIPGVRAARRVVDIGPGAGFPGLALAATMPADAGTRLLESSIRACDFLVRATRVMGLDRVEVVHRRAEAWPEGQGVHDLVLARAVGPLPVVLEYAAPLLRVSAAALLWRGTRESDEDERGARAADTLGLELKEVRRTAPFPGARHHHLYLYVKVQETPARFPRRPGAATRRPLG
ncbi:MAG TPA: RsmG family class I SAM-dependent methyltransferase [Solirubrobacteraceae bacterium]|nr:RsmG family class I SAM-dependent methyltransferase [Solirubrobacteraceae bacterium]